jgi:heat shock protein HslJ
MMKRHLSAALIVGGLWMSTAGSTHAATPLRGTTWAMGEQSRPRLVFDATQLTFSGIAQCNRFGGHFVLNGNQLQLQATMSTRRACYPDEGGEEQFMQALADVRQWRIEGQELQLQNAAGQTLIKLQAQATMAR